MKLVKSLFTVAIATIISLTQTAQAFEERVVALVNDIPVMESQVQRILGKKKASKASRRAAIDDIIDDMLVQQVTQEAGIKISPADVNQAVENVAIQNGITYGQLLDEAPLSLEGIEVRRLPFYKLSSQFINLDQSKTYLLYCQRGVMSKLQALYLKDNGYSNVKVFRSK